MQSAEIRVIGKIYSDCLSMCTKSRDKVKGRYWLYISSVTRLCRTNYKYALVRLIANAFVLIIMQMLTTGLDNIGG